jgi:PTH1 family peptidyl-tRNA hydrolase
MQSIISALGTDEFVRVRLGVRPEKIWGDRRDYVLATMSREERQIAQEMAVEAADAVELVLTEGVEKAMSRFNRKATADEETSE